MRKATVKEAAKEWLRGFNAIPQALNKMNLKSERGVKMGLDWNFEQLKQHIKN